MVIFLLLRDNKNISPWHIILNNVQNKKQSGVDNNKLMLQEKVFHVNKKKLMFENKLFHADKNKMMLHKKNILCLEKLLNFSGTWRHKNE